jgi:integrase
VGACTATPRSRSSARVAGRSTGRRSPPSSAARSSPSRPSYATGSRCACCSTTGCARALKAVQFKHFDHRRRRLTIFTKGQKVRELPIPHAPFWLDLERHIIEVEAKPDHYLMPRMKGNGAKVTRDPTKPMGIHGMHSWWYRRLADAGIVPEGTTSGERMHKARHTAGQRVLDATGNLKAVQKLLGHASIQTTGDIYADWEIDQLAATMADVLAADENDDETADSQSFPPSPPQKPAICSGNEDSMETVGIEPTSVIA